MVNKKALPGTNISSLLRWKATKKGEKTADQVIIVTITLGFYLSLYFFSERPGYVPFEALASADNTSAESPCYLVN